MSAEAMNDAAAVEPRITVDDVKHRAREVRDLAKYEAKRATDEVLHEQVGRTIVIGTVAVVALVSIAFFMGARSGARRLPPPPAPPGRY